MNQALHPTIFHIKINTDEMAVQQQTLTFEDICRLAFPDGPFGGNILYTVTYSGPHRGEGHMVADSVPLQLENGLKLYVGNTDRS